jgi:hypothetical protein
MKRFVPHIVIIIFGILCGFFVCQSFFYLPPSVHPLSWERANWITTPTKSPVGLFRKEIFIADKISGAWIQISAPDTYSLSVNEEPVIENTFYSSNVSGVHDITNYLHLGRNVIAISVRRLSFPGQSKVVVKGSYTEINGNETAFFSNSTWKVFDREDCRGGISWASQLFDASSWPSAVMIGEPKPGETYPVTLSPEAITSSLSAEWIRHPDPYSKQANFRKDFFLPENPLDGWIRISTSTDYDLLVNGVAVGIGNAANKLDIYDIDGLLRKGNNLIEVGIKNPLQIAHAFYLDGEISGKNFTLPILTGSDWKSYLPHSAFQFERPFVIGNYQAYQFTNRSKILTELKLPFDYDAKKFLTASGIIGLTILFVYILVTLASKGLSLFSRFSFRDCFSISSFTLLIPLLLLLLLFILQFDIRIAQRDLFNPGAVYGVLLLFLLSQVIVAAVLRLRKIKEITETHLTSQNSRVLKRSIGIIAIILLILIGAFFRLNNLGYISLNGDEVGTVRFAQGILNKGYPYITIGGIDKPATTYELLSYPVAVAIGLFGISETTVRLPSALFGIANIFLIFWVGMKFVNIRTGLLAAAIYAFMPLEINLAQNARYMIGEQFYALLCCYFYYKAIEKEEINKRAVYAASVFFILGYLTWEGSGYLLPSLLVATFFVKGRDFRWMKNWHLWVASVGTGVIVLIQLAHRTYWSVPFMILGSGLSDATFKLMFLTQVYNPWYYINNFLLTQNHIFLTALTLIGLPIILINRELRYIFILLVSVLFFFSNTFSLYAARYIYFLQPLLIILGCAVLLKLAELASSVVKEFHFPVLKGLRYGIPFVLSGMLLMVTGDYILKPYRLSPNPAPGENPRSLDLGAIAVERRNLYPVDFKGINKFVKDNLRDGDVVITVYTHPTLFYAGKADYFEETKVDTQIVYLDDNDSQRLVNKTVDIPTITDLPSFQRFLSDHKRVWFVASSFDLFNYLNEKDFITYFLKTMKPVHESYRARVYLWDNGRRI